LLILTRRIGEAVVIGDNEINFTILGVKGNQVRLGLTASENIPIHREEIYRRIQLEKHQNKSKDESSIDEAITEQLKTHFKRLSNDVIAH